MTQRSLTSMDNAIRGLRRINPIAFEKTYIKTLQWYLDVLIIRHFISGYARRQGWRPNSPEYIKWKTGAGYGNVQLVLRGKLRQDAKRGKINKAGKKYLIRWNGKQARTVGVYQKRKGRDWATPSQKDGKNMIRKFKSEFAKLRAKQRGIKIRR